MTPNIHTIIRQHVSLEVRCIDRVYLHAYMPKLQTSGGLCYFLHDYLGHPVPSPALLKPRHDRFVAAVSLRSAAALPSCRSSAAEQGRVRGADRARFPRTRASCYRRRAGKDAVVQSAQTTGPGPHARV